jgi:D-amino-acid oxidase
VNLSFCYDPPVTKSHCRSSASKIWFEKHMKKFCEGSAEDLKNMPKQIIRAYFRETIVLNAPKYLHYVFNRAKSLGAETMAVDITCSAMQNVLSFCEAQYQGMYPARKAFAYVNATGIGALKLVPDPAVHPIRGVTVLLEGQASRVTSVQWRASSKATVTYILPRPGTNSAVIGGTKQVGDWTAEPYPGEVETILHTALRFAPELIAKHGGEFKVLKVQVGLRPGREGGPRVELEQVGERLVCHAYGNGSCGKSSCLNCRFCSNISGYQNSIGVARKVVRLLRN